MQEALREYDDCEELLEQLEEIMKPALLPVAEAIEEAKKVVLEPRSTGVKRKAQAEATGRGGKAQARKAAPLESGLDVLKAHGYDVLTACSKRGDKFLAAPQLKALAGYKQVDTNGLTKKQDLADKLHDADVFAAEKAALPGAA